MTNFLHTARIENVDMMLLRYDENEVVVNINFVTLKLLLQELLNGVIAPGKPRTNCQIIITSRE